jgi:FMN phosphatase YigB (HAD superfamily)
MTLEEIRARYVGLHADLERRFYKEHAMTKEEFDSLHQKLWQDYDQELANAGFLAPEPRDLAKEIDELKARVAELERR